MPESKRGQVSGPRRESVVRTLLVALIVSLFCSSLVVVPTAKTLNAFLA